MKLRLTVIAIGFALAGTGCGKSPFIDDASTRSTAALHRGDPVISVAPGSWMTSASSEPGIIVAEPVVKSATPELSAFSAGCARWLEFVVAGQPEFGQTPLYSAVDRAREELGKPDVRLTPAEAAKAAGMTGATHVAVGTVSGDAAHCTLTYQLLAFPGGYSLGAPISADGTEAQVVAKLPEMARMLTQRLGVSSPRIPASVGASSADLITIGALPWLPATLKPEAKTALSSLAERFPLAGLIVTRSDKPYNYSAHAAMVKRLLNQAPDNALILGELTLSYPNALPLKGKELKAQARQYPKSYLAAVGGVWAQGRPGDIDGRLSAAELLARDAPHNPGALLNLGQALSDKSEEIRRSRFSTELSSDEWSALTKLYAEEVRADKRATQLDPNYGLAWQYLATAASFAGDGRLADKAFDRAMKLKDNKNSLYWWGLQMYQPKWYYNHDKLVHLAYENAAFFHYNNRAFDGVEALQNSQLKPEARQLEKVIIDNDRKLVREYPKDSTLRYNLGMALKHTGDLTGATQVLTALVSDDPKNPQGRYALGLVYVQRKMYGKAIPQLVKASKVYSSDYALRHNIAWAYKHVGYLKEADWIYRNMTQAQPRDHIGHRELADTLVLENKPEEALKEARMAVDLQKDGSRDWVVLSNAQTLAGKYDDAVESGEKALTLRPDAQDAGDAHSALAGAYAKMGDPSKALKERRASVAANPDDLDARAALGSALAAQGKSAAARVEWTFVAQHAEPDSKAASAAKQALSNLSAH